MQAKFKDSENSWTVDIKTIDKATYDLSVKNPNKADEASCATPRTSLLKWRRWMRRAARSSSRLRRCYERKQSSPERLERNSVGNAQLSGRIGWKGLTAKEYTKEGPLFLSVHSLNYGDYVDYRNAFHISQERYDESPEIMLRQNDVLICKDGAGIGKGRDRRRQVPKQTTINSSLLLVRTQEGILPKYLYYTLSSPYFQDIREISIDGRDNAAPIPTGYHRIPVYLPPLAEQQRIVAVLDEAFAGLATMAANAEKNSRTHASCSRAISIQFSRRGMANGLKNHFEKCRSNLEEGNRSTGREMIPRCMMGSIHLSKLAISATAGASISEYSQTYNETGLSSE